MTEQKEDWVFLFKSSALSLYYHLERLKVGQKESTRSDSNSTFSALRPAIDYISQNYMQKIVIKELAILCHLSENHFRRQFLSIMGTSPLAFINFTRINQACIMLSTTNRSILTIAEEVGFSSVASFNRNFKELLGVSPNAYRKKAATKERLSMDHRFIKTYQGWVQAEVDPD
jgi:AraC-like DNA-binding protein